MTLYTKMYCLFILYQIYYFIAKQKYKSITNNQFNEYKYTLTFLLNLLYNNIFVNFSYLFSTFIECITFLFI